MAPRNIASHLANEPKSKKPSNSRLDDQFEKLGRHNQPQIALDRAGNNGGGQLLSPRSLSG